MIFSFINLFPSSSEENKFENVSPASKTARFLAFFNPISTGLFYLVVALGGGGDSSPSIKFDTDILEH